MAMILDVITQLCSISAWGVHGPGNLVHQHHSLTLEHETIDRFFYGRSRVHWYLLLRDVVEFLEAGVGVLSAGDCPDAVVLFDQIVDYAQELSSVLFYEIHIGYATLGEGLPGKAVTHAIHIHGDFQPNSVILRLDKQHLVLQKLVEILHKNALILLPRVLEITASERRLLVHIADFE